MGFIDIDCFCFPQENCHLQRASPFRAPAPVGWIGMPGLPNPPIVKKVIRLDVPVDKYPSVSCKSLAKFVIRIGVVLEFKSIERCSIILLGGFSGHVETP